MANTSILKIFKNIGFVPSDAQLSLLIKALERRQESEGGSDDLLEREETTAKRVFKETNKKPSFTLLFFGLAIGVGSILGILDVGLTVSLLNPAIVVPGVLLVMTSLGIDRYRYIQQKQNYMNSHVGLKLMGLLLAEMERQPNAFDDQDFKLVKDKILEIQKLRMVTEEKSRHWGLRDRHDLLRMASSGALAGLILWTAGVGLNIVFASMLAGAFLGYVANEVYNNYHEKKNMEEVTYLRKDEFDPERAKTEALEIAPEELRQKLINMDIVDPKQKPVWADRMQSRVNHEKGDNIPDLNDVLFL